METVFFTLLFPLLFSLSFIFTAKRTGLFLEKDFTNVIKGLCCILVVYVHIRDKYQNPLQDAIGSFAYVAVTLFFLFSAYGMLYSLKKNKLYLTNFWRNRLVSLLIPCFLVNLVGGLIKFCKGDCLSIIYFLHISDYVVVLLQWCLWFYIVSICKKKWFDSDERLFDVLLIAGVIISSLVLYFFFDAEFGWCYERIGLVWGVLLYRHLEKISSWMSSRNKATIFLLTTLGLIFGVAYLKFKMVYFIGAYLLKIVLGITLIVLLFTVTSNLTTSNKLCRWLGDISYEVYLSHGLVIGFFAEQLIFEMNSGVFIFLSFLGTLILSTLIHSLSKPIVAYFRS